MSYTFLQEQGAESSAECFSDIPAYVLSRLNLTVEKSYSNGNETESCQSSQSGMMLQPSMQNHGKGVLMWYAEGSPVRTYLPPEKEQELEEENDLDCGPTLPESLAKYVPSLYGWRTAQCSLFGGLTSFLETWPQWGLMRSGELFRQKTRVLPMREKESGFWPTPVKNEGPGSMTLKLTDAVMLLLGIKPQYYKGQLPTPTARDWKDNGKSPAELERNSATLATIAGGKLNPDWVEWLMGWPEGWTDLQPLETDKFRQWLSSHGKCFAPEFLAQSKNPNR